MRKIKVAMIGVGDISGIYLKNIHEVFKELELVGVCDLVRAKAEKAQTAYNIPRIYENMMEALADEQVELVLNLTRPDEHYEVTRQALLHGKHVYSEKPLAATFELGQELVKLAKEKGLLLGGAPDTYLGAGIQTCRKLIDDGYIGTPVGAAAFMICRGHEGWHPDPEFYYKRGGGPMLDMGPYYVTALVNLLGGVSSLTGVTKKAFPQRTITSQPKAGTVIDVDVPTYVTGMMQFACGAVGTIFTTFDVHYPSQARLEIYGSEGTLFCPDPNTFGGPIKLFRPEMKEVYEMPLVFDYAQNSRGLGLADMAKSIGNTERPVRASYKQTLHVLEIMTGFEKSSDAGKTIELTTAYARERPMKKAILQGVLDD